MSFGFSVGDFLAVGKLILDITKSLQSVGGAKSEYQEVIRQLKILNNALQQLHQLGKRDRTTATVQAIGEACRS